MTWGGFAPVTLGSIGDLESLTPRLERLVASRLSCQLAGRQARILSGLPALLTESILWYVMPSTPFAKELPRRATGKRLSPGVLFFTRSKSQRPGKGRLLALWPYLYTGSSYGSDVVAVVSRFFNPKWLATRGKKTGGERKAGT